MCVCTYYLSRFTRLAVISGVHACDRAAKDFMPSGNLGSVVLNTSTNAQRCLFRPRFNEQLDS